MTVHKHPTQPELQSEVVLASKGPDQPPIYTIRLRYPRPIHGEFMTHRVFSRNARSSRAVPVGRMLQEVREIPYVPWHWHKNQSGMQGTLPLSEPEIAEAKQVWLAARDGAIKHTELLQANPGLNVHKQNPNRLLEPFSWIDVLATSTDWDNFLWLRDHEDAEPHIADLARLVKQAIDSCNIQDLLPGEWHLPYITEEDLYKIDHEFNDGDHTVVDLAKPVSAGRCARISYAPFGSKEPDILSDIYLYQKLIGNARIHASPMEHQATPDILVGEHVPEWNKPELHGNLNGYIQFRKTIPGERWTKGMSG